MYIVAPLVGAWIEIERKYVKPCDKTVAPLVGAWIEIHGITARCLSAWSLLSWERGLKYFIMQNIVAEKMSLLSWERGLKYEKVAVLPLLDSRSSRGSVD